MGPSAGSSSPLDGLAPADLRRNERPSSMLRAVDSLLSAGAGVGAGRSALFNDGSTECSQAPPG